MSRLNMAFEGDREFQLLFVISKMGKFKHYARIIYGKDLDLPEEALTRVIIFDLPFPPHDPLFDAKRSFAENPFEEVELPFMQLRLQQGMGRLIRTSNDHGDIHILLNEEDDKVRSEFIDILPVQPK